MITIYFPKIVWSILFFHYICGVFRAEWSQCLSYPIDQKAFFAFILIDEFAKIQTHCRMKSTRRSCVGIYLWHALTLLFYMLNSVGLLLLFHYNVGVWRYQSINESETRLTLFLYPYVSCCFGVFYSTKVNVSSMNS